MVVLVLEVLVRSGSTRAERERTRPAKLRIGFDTRIGARDDPQPIASISRLAIGVVETRVEAGHQSVHLVRRQQQRVPHTQVYAQSAIDLPRVPSIELVVAPPHLVINVSGYLGEVLEDVAGNHCVSQPTCAVRHPANGVGVCNAVVCAFRGSSTIELVLEIESQERAEFEAVRAMDPGKIVAHVVQVLLVVPRSNHLRRAARETRVEGGNTDGMTLQAGRKYGWKIRIQLRRQAGISPTDSNEDTVVGVGELGRVDQVGTNRRSYLANDRFRRLRPAALQFGISIVTPKAQE